MSNLLSNEQADNLALQFRQNLGISITEPITTKNLIRQLGILTMYKPMSKMSYGMALLSSDKKYKFILINSNNSKGRQHFTIGHEIFHLYYDKNPLPHICTQQGEKSITERNADKFASSLLMSKESIVANVPQKEIQGHISMATILKLQHLLSVSYQALLYRLKNLHFISENELQKLLPLPITTIAREYGYNSNLYRGGNENLIIGDFGEKAKKLFDTEKISEGHYIGLLSKIGNE